MVIGEELKGWLMAILVKLCMTGSGAVIVLAPNNRAAQGDYEGCPRGTFLKFRKEAPSDEIFLRMWPQFSLERDTCLRD